MPILPLQRGTLRKPTRAVEEGLTCHKVQATLKLRSNTASLDLHCSCYDCYDVSATAIFIATSCLLVKTIHFIISLQHKHIHGALLARMKVEVG